MVDYCANPNCLKPLLYLREGTIYIFEETHEDAEASSRRTHQIEHYWLCGGCSHVYRLERTTSSEVRLTAKQTQRFVRERRVDAERLLVAETA